MCARANSSSLSLSLSFTAFLGYPSPSLPFLHSRPRLSFSFFLLSPHLFSFARFQVCLCELLLLSFRSFAPRGRWVSACACRFSEPRDKERLVPSIGRDARDIPTPFDKICRHSRPEIPAVTAGALRAQTFPRRRRGVIPESCCWATVKSVPSHAFPSTHASSSSCFIACGPRLVVGSCCCLHWRPKPTTELLSNLPVPLRTSRTSAITAPPFPILRTSRVAVLRNGARLLDHPHLSSSSSWN